MNRDRLIRKIRKWSKANKLAFHEDSRAGKGSHIKVSVGTRTTTIPRGLDPTLVKAIAKQLGIPPDDL